MIHQKTYVVSTKKEGRYTLVVIKASMYWHFEIVMSIYSKEMCLHTHKHTTHCLKSRILYSEMEC